MPAAPPRVAAPALRAARRRPSVPFSIALDGGGEITLSRLLRVLPGRRVVGEARYQGQPVLAKLFVAPASRRYWRRERAGILALAGAGIPTPALLAAGRLAEGGYYLLTAFLPDARTLAEIPLDTIDAAPLLLEAARLLGRMHASGLAQTDLHLGNLLHHASTLYMIDGDGVRRRGRDRSLEPQPARQNLATFLALLPGSLAAMTPALLAAYRAANPGVVIDEAAILARSQRIRERRLQNQLRKCFRDCSRFSVERRNGRFTAALRSEADWLAPLLAAPGHYQALGRRLEPAATDGSVMADVGGRRVVIRAFPSTGWLSRLIPGRRSPAALAWRDANRARLLGDPGPRPLALIEQPTGLLQGRAWLVTEHTAPHQA